MLESGELKETGSVKPSKGGPQGLDGGQQRAFGRGRSGVRREILPSSKWSMS